MNTRYNMDEWVAATTHGRRVFNYGYRLMGNEFKGWRLVSVVDLENSPDEKHRAYMWQNAHDPEHSIIRADITERPSWRLAQESLHEHLMNSMRPDIPRGTKRLSVIGDINFVSREPCTDIPAAVSFTRGNILVTVRSAGEKNVDVSEVALVIDVALREVPRGKDVEKVLSPTVATVKENEAFTLIESLQKTTPEGRWLKIVVPDGELARKGDALIYVSAQGGTKQVGIFTVGDNRKGRPVKGSK